MPNQFTDKPALPPEELHNRRMRAMELRIEGKSYPQIAKELGVSIGVAYHDVNFRVNQIIKEEKESASEVREVELARLDRLANAVWPDANSGDLKAIETYLKIQQRRSRLLGLDAAQKIKVEDERESTRQRSAEEIYNRVRVLHERLAAAGVKFDPILTERSPFEALREIKQKAIEGEVVKNDGDEGP